MPKNLTIAHMQIGKNGVTEGTLVWLENTFKTHIKVKISVLKSAGHTKENVKEMAEKIVNKLGRNYAYKIVGFTITILKFRKPVRIYIL